MSSSRIEKYLNERASKVQISKAGEEFIEAASRGDVGAVGDIIVRSQQEGLAPSKSGIPHDVFIVSLHAALAEGHADCVAVMLSKAGYQQLYSERGLVLLKAAYTYGYGDVVKMLINKGVKVDAPFMRLVIGITHRGEAEEAIIKHYLDTIVSEVGKGFPPDELFDALSITLKVGNKEMAGQLLSKFCCDVASYSGQELLEKAVSQCNGSAVDFLLAKGAIVNNLMLRRLIHQQRSARDVLRAFLNHGVDISQGCSGGETPLHIIAKFGLHEFIQRFIDKGIDVDAVDDDCNTPLIACADTLYKRDEDVADIVKTADALLQAGASVNANNIHGSTALSKALARRCFSVMRVLFAHHADPNYVPTYAMYPVVPLIFRATHMDNVAIQFLLEHGADVNHNHNGATLLTDFIQRSDNVDSMAVLLEYGADVNQCDKHGRTALWHAVQKGWQEAVDMLVLYGAKIDKGVLAIANNDTRRLIVRSQIIKERKEAKEKTRQLQSSNANQSALALCEAVKVGKDGDVQRLLDEGVSVNARDADGRSLLYLAACHHHPSTVQLLLKRGAVVSNAEFNVVGDQLYLAPQDGQGEIAASISAAKRSQDRLGMLSSAPVSLFGAEAAVSAQPAAVAASVRKVTA